MASVLVRGPLTETNLRKLEPSIIQPMPPVLISSTSETDPEQAADDNTASAKETPATKVARLRTWVYNAMLTLAGLGDEGMEILNADELYIAGPGNVRLWAKDQRKKAARLKREEDEGFVVDGNEDKDEDENEEEEQDEEAEDSWEARDDPDLTNPAFWQAKLDYLESKCRPLSQERRKRRRLAPQSQIAAEDAARAEAEARAAEGGRFSLSPAMRQTKTSEDERQRHREERQARKEARTEREYIEQSKLLWREKRCRIDRWVQALTPPALTQSSGGGCFWRAAGVPPHAAPFFGVISGPSPPQIVDPANMSDSSIVEITLAQFSNVRQQDQRQQQHEEEDGNGAACDAKDDAERSRDPKCHKGADLPQAIVKTVLEHAAEHIEDATVQADKNKQKRAKDRTGSLPHRAEKWERRGVEEKKQLQQQQQRQQEQQKLVPAVAVEASVDLSAATAVTAAPTAATPATIAVGTPNTSALTGEGTNADAVPASESATTKSKAPMPAVLGKRRRGEMDAEVTSGRT